MKRYGIDLIFALDHARFIQLIIKKCISRVLILFYFTFILLFKIVNF